jgi:hypothetical protein
VPPGVKLAGREKHAIPFLQEYFRKFAEVKKKHLGDRQYWYLNLIGRDPERKESGLSFPFLAV